MGLRRNKIGRGHYIPPIREEINRGAKVITLGWGWGARGGADTQNAQEFAPQHHKNKGKGRK